MKKQVRKLIVIALVWCLIIVSLVINRTYAEEEQQQNLNISIEANKSKYEPGNEIEVKIKLNKKVMAASYYLNYNSSELTYKESKTANLVVKDYPSDNLVRVMYADITGTGVEELKLVFTAKSTANRDVSFNLTNTTMTTSQDSKSYSNNQITGIQNGLTVKLKEDENITNTIDNTITNTVTNTVDNIIENTITNTVDNTIKNTVTNTNTNTVKNEINSNKTNNVTDKTSATENIPKTGTNDMIFMMLGVMLVLTTVYFGYNVRKLGRDF